MNTLCTLQRKLLKASFNALRNLIVTDERCAKRYPGALLSWTNESAKRYPRKIFTTKMSNEQSDENSDPCEGCVNNPQMHRRTPYRSSSLHETLKTVAGIAGNVLEWYDFAVFGFFSDILGLVFFPKDQPEDLSVMESFAVFGCAFLMRPVGGLVIGYIGESLLAPVLFVVDYCHDCF